jgi:hypothetical protein
MLISNVFYIKLWKDKIQAQEHSVTGCNEMNNK